MKTLQAKDWPEIAPPGGRIFLGSAAACPHALISLMLAERAKLRDVEIVHILTLGPSPWVEKAARQTFRTNSFFLNADVREAVNEGEADYTPSFLGDVPSLFDAKVMPLDSALIMVSPPDADGNCSLGVSVDVIPSAIRNARHVVAQINPKMPRTCGDTKIHISHIDYSVEIESELPEYTSTGDKETADKIARYVSQLIVDGSTLQLGIGKIPDKVCGALMGHRHLGLHTEMFSDGVRKLMEAGVIDNSCKKLNRGKSVSSFCIGSGELYKWTNENPQLSFHPTDYTNNIHVIAQHNKMVSINSAVEVDLTGQVSADTVGGRFYSGIGGMIDFVRGASMSHEGMPVIALPSTAEGGQVSRIVTRLSPDAGVVCSRADIHFVVTEYGIASLRGRSIRERTLELIQVAHPKFRDDLLKNAQDRKLISPFEGLTPKPVRAIGGVEFQRIKLAGEDYILRPLHPSDSRRLQEFFYSHTPETIHNRYGYHPSGMSRNRADELVGVDQEKDLALGIFEMHGPMQRIHAVGRYFLNEDGQSGECAFVVRESMQRHGMGGVLFRKLIEIGHRRGLKTMWAIVARENDPMLNLFKKFGATIRPRQDESGYLVNIDLKLISSHSKNSTKDRCDSKGSSL